MSTEKTNRHDICYRDGFEVYGNYWGESIPEEGPAAIEAETAPQSSSTAGPEKEPIDQKRREANAEIIAALRSTLSGGC